MKTVRRFVPVFTGLIAVSGVWGAAAVGCSSNGASSSGPPDATSDAEGDGQADGTMEAEPDTGSGTDAQQDVVVVDSQPAPDSGQATMPDADAAPADAGPDVYDASAALAFPGQVATSLCNTLATCCGTSGDAATFNWTLCYDDEYPAGFAGSSIDAYLFSNGNMTFNAASANACLVDLSQIDCTTNQIPTALEVKLYADCFGAYAGTLPAGSACQGSIECAPGNYCLMPLDAGVDGGAVGTCQTLLGNNGACGAQGSLNAQSLCSYNASGSNGMSCQEWAPGVPTDKLEAGSWFCTPQTAIGTPCSTNLNCTSLECSGHLCSSAIVAVGASACTLFAIADAGGD